MKKPIDKSNGGLFIFGECDVYESPYSAGEVFEHWKTVFGKTRARMDDKRKKLITAALKMGYSVTDLKAAIDGVRNSPHNMGYNDRHTKYIDIGLIFRDADHIDKYMERAPRIELRVPEWRDGMVGMSVSFDPEVRKKALKDIKKMAGVRAK